MDNNPFLDRLLNNVGEQLLVKFLTNKEYQEKLLKDMNDLNKKLDEMAKKVKEQDKNKIIPK